MWSTAIKARVTAGATTATILSASITLVLGFLGSRVLGLLRNMVLASTFGAGPELDAYFAAFRLPDAIFQLIVGAALGSAFIPYFTAKFTKDSPDDAWRLASAVLTWSSIAGAVIAVVGFLVAPWFVPLTVIGASAETQALTVHLTQIMLGSSAFFCASVVVTGILNSRHHFALPALAPILYNLCIIGGTFWLVQPLGVAGPAWGVTIGALLHLLVQLPGLPLVGMKYTPWTHPGEAGVGEVLKLMGPRALSVATAQIYWIITILLASTLAPGSITALTYAWALMMLPLSLLGMAPATAAFPSLAYTAAAEDWSRFQRMLTNGFRLAIFVSLPATVGLILVREPLVALLFQRGAFEAQSTALTATALLFFTVGLISHVTLEVSARGFYALQDTRTPLMFAIAGMSLHGVLSILLGSSYGVAGLALAMSISTSFEVVCQMIALTRRLGGLDWAELAMSGVKTAVAAGIMGAAVYALVGALGETSGTTKQVLVLMSAGGVGVSVFAACAALLRSADLELVLRQVRAARRA